MTALLTVLVWPFSLILLFVGPFLGIRYSFRGPDISTTVSDFMNKAQERPPWLSKPRRNNPAVQK